MEIESGDNCVSRHGRCHDFLRSFAAVLVERNFVFAVLAGQHLIEGLLKTFPSFGFRPEHFVVVDDSVRIPASLSAIPNDLSRDFSIGIGAHIKRTQRDSRWQVFFHRIVF